MKIADEFKKIGVVGVDSGQILITDPCYIESEWRKKKKGESIFDKKNKGEYSYSGCCLATGGKKKSGQLNYKLGHKGVGVASSSGLGDGVYPVYAKIVDGRVSHIIIDFGIED